MGPKSELKAGRQYECRDGVNRWLVMFHKPGSGHSVTWDTVDPSQPNYWGSGLVGRMNEGQAGKMALRQFERLVVRECVAQV